MKLIQPASIFLGMPRCAFVSFSLLLCLSVCLCVYLFMNKCQTVSVSLCLVEYVYLFLPRWVCDKSTTGMEEWNFWFVGWWKKRRKEIFHWLFWIPKIKEYINIRGVNLVWKWVGVVGPGFKTGGSWVWVWKLGDHGSGFENRDPKSSTDRGT